MMALRDPVHKWINYSKAEQALISTPLVQRLRWIGQLTVVSMVYQGGKHSRFEHSMGVMHLAGEYMKRILKTTDDPSFINRKKWIIQLARVAGLLHDIGHGPFSHSFDKAVYSKIVKSTDGHDYQRHAIIKNDPDIQKALTGLGISSNDVSKVWGNKGLVESESDLDRDSVFSVIRAILQGPLGADRMDFTLRDSYHTGTQHFGTIAVVRIMDNSKILDGKLILDGKVLNDVVNALRGRAHMYESVYLHKTSMAGSLLVEKYLEEMFHKLDLGRRASDLELFKHLTDHVLSESQVLGISSKFADHVFQRKFPKMIYESRVSANNDFQKHEYLDLLGEIFPGLEVEIVKSKTITGVESSGFDKHGIKFSFSNKLIGFNDALKNLNYSEDPGFYFVRAFDMSEFV